MQACTGEPISSPPWACQGPVPHHHQEARPDNFSPGSPPCGPGSRDWYPHFKEEHWSSEGLARGHTANAGARLSKTLEVRPGSPDGSLGKTLKLTPMAHTEKQGGRRGAVDSVRQSTEVTASVSPAHPGRLPRSHRCSLQGRECRQEPPLCRRAGTHIGGALPENREASLSGCISWHCQDETHSPAVATHPATPSASTLGERHLRASPGPPAPPVRPSLDADEESVSHRPCPQGPPDAPGLSPRMWGSAPLPGWWDGGPSEDP